jgi:hypothetical protein
LDPAQIPSAPDLSYHDEEKWMKESYLTVGDQVVPLSDSIYHAIDQGILITTKNLGICQKIF